mmetsp:Transcript_16691/g.56087  ORF Transcript_16691/g.56087 Transcript_16691/m.56087 type:complete len:124 (-) Transcript_16691:249-620(-)
MATEAEKVVDEEKPSELSMDTEVLRKSCNYALIKNCDMSEEMRQDCIELVITAIEKFQTNYESACRLVKETMDKKYGEYWCVIIGGGFGFEVTHEVKHVIWLFFGGQLSVLVFKAGARQTGAK